MTLVPVAPATTAPAATSFALLAALVRLLLALRGPPGVCLRRWTLGRLLLLTRLLLTWLLLARLL